MRLIEDPEEACQYLYSFIDNDTGLGREWLANIVTDECFHRMIEIGYLRLFQGSYGIIWYKFCYIP